ncbi:MAG: shikimate kinase [Gemmatimonadota bacterium]|nr:shikimate kinase [Gemmatimonadota bacterium]
MSADLDGRRSALQRVFLVGFMGSGKSSVGRRLATVLGWRFLDFDEAVAAEEGLSVPDIFRTLGEAHFRRAEARIGRRLLSQERVVLASGGGWGAVPGRLDEVPPGTETFWLRVSPEEAVRRASDGHDERPLLSGGDPLDAARRLLEARERQYGRAGSVVDTDGRSVEDVTTEVLAILGRKHPEVTRTEAE